MPPLQQQGSAVQALEFKGQDTGVVKVAVPAPTLLIPQEKQAQQTQQSCKEEEHTALGQE